MKQYFKMYIVVLIFTVLMVLGSLNYHQANILRTDDQNTPDSKNNSFGKLSGSGSGTVIDFETAPTAGNINNYVSYLKFGSTWTYTNTSGAATAFAHSGTNVIYGTTANDWINFTTPQQDVELFFMFDSTATSGPYTIQSYNHLGGVIQTTTVTTGSVYQNITFTGHDIIGVKISGTAYDYYVDDLYFENDTALPLIQGGLLMNFEQAPPSGSINNYAPYVQFTSSLLRIDTSSQPFFGAYSGSFALEGTQNTGNISFTVPQKYVSFYFISNITSPYTISVYNHLGSLINSNSGNYLVPYTNITFSNSDISQINITVTGGAYAYALDNLYFRNDTWTPPLTAKYLDFENAPPGGDLNNYVPYLSFGNSWYRFDASSQTILKAHNGSFVIQPNSNSAMMNFSVPQKLVNFWFIMSTPGALYYITAYNSSNAGVSYYADSTSGTYYNVNLTGSDIVSVVITSASANWHSNMVIDQLYFENDTSTMHTILTPLIQSPTNGSIVSGLTTVNYLKGIDSFGHTVEYNITLTDSATGKVFSITSFYSSLSYTLNTTSFANSGYYLKVMAFDSFGLTNSSMVLIKISNPDTISIPIINDPINGTTINGTITITFTPSDDSLGHQVLYKILITGPNNYEFTTNITQTSYNFDSTKVLNGDYTVNIQGYDGYGTYSASTILYFTVNNTIVNSSNNTGNNSTTSSNTGSTSSTSTITASPGFELMYPLLVFGLGSIIIRKKRKN